MRKRAYQYFQLDRDESRVTYPKWQLFKLMEIAGLCNIHPNDAEEYPDDSFERMRELVADGTVAYDAYLRDGSQAVADAYGAACTPDPFLFDGTDGKFTLAYHGRLDDAQSPDAEPSGEPGFEIRQAIDAVLAGEPVAVEEVPSRGCSIKWK